MTARHKPNFDTSPRIQPALADIDYNHLAELEKQHGIPFDRLCERAEKGARTDADLIRAPGLIAPCDKWVTVDTACVILGIETSTFYCAVSRQGHYSGVGWKSRSRKVQIAGELNANGNPVGKRGCGVLFRRADLERLRDIKRACGISYNAASKVFHAMQQGRI